MAEHQSNEKRSLDCVCSCSCRCHDNVSDQKYRTIRVLRDTHNGTNLYVSTPAQTKFFLVEDDQSNEPE